ncbi:lysyl oxidase family protein [Sorangium sp. So ce131]|uniref:lysyl oxidase family protein n=1 Tax=Sorangium sp. So ce131 TaxID=3133282 RepID=UPI003F6394D0
MKLTRLAVLATMALAGCSGAPVGEEETVGEVELNLLGFAPSGNQYRLRDATVMVQGPDSTLFFNTEDDPNRFSLSASVTAGSYFTWLQEGWRLERLNGGAPQTVEAELLSPNPTYFDVFPQQTTPVVLRFRAGGDDVSLNQGSFEIFIDVEEGPAESTLCRDDSECGPGQTCCLAGFLGTCTSLEAGEACPLPDLTVSADVAQSSLYINRQYFPADSCAIAESCIDAPGERRLLNFSTQTPNIGEADMVLGNPLDVQDFEFSSCHGHYHFEGYARYELVDLVGNVVATGHKQAFCLLDSSPVGIPGSPSTPRYHCEFQGIQRGWSDVYGAGLDCQWVDITDVPSGDYALRIMINPDQTLPESDYSNNIIEVPVFIPDDGSTGGPTGPLSPCPPGTSGAGRDCGWSIAAGAQSLACEPGAPVTVGCGCATGGACAGDPMIRVCEGAEGCTLSTSLADEDDTCGRCPETMFICPPSGSYTVLVAPYSTFSAATCEVAVAP